MKAAREYLAAAHEFMVGADAATLGGAVQAYNLAAAQVAATAACAAATLEAVAAAADQPERFAAATPDTGVLCGAIPPGHVTTMLGIYCEKPYSHDGAHRAVLPTYHSDDAVTW